MSEYSPSEQPPEQYGLSEISQPDEECISLREIFERRGHQRLSPDMEIAPAQPPDSETRDGVAERLAAWQKYSQEPDVSLGQGVQWRPGQSLSQLGNGIRMFLAAAAEKEAQEHPEDRAAQERADYWREEVRWQLAYEAFESDPNPSYNFFQSDLHMQHMKRVQGTTSPDAD